MLPWKSTSTTGICLSETNFFTLMSTAVVITAAATFWCTRRFRSCSHKSSTSVTPTTVIEAPKSRPVALESAPADESSYLCTSCGTEKYTAEQLSAQAPSKSSPYKMVILVRTDLNMGKGKAAAQCCHAVLAAFKTATFKSADVLKRWEREGQPKVTLKIDSETEMIELMQKARLAGVVAESIRDAGRTQVAAGTRTVCAIGPAPAKLIDTITGHLKLY